MRARYSNKVFEAVKTGSSHQIHRKITIHLRPGVGEIPSPRPFTRPNRSRGPGPRPATAAVI